MSAGSIPQIKGVESELAKVLAAMKENIDEVRGRLPRQTKIKTLSANASTADVVAKVNELLRLLQS